MGFIDLPSECVARKKFGCNEGNEWAETRIAITDQKPMLS